MMFASACLVCLFASSFAVPVPRSKAGDQLLAALGAGTGAALGQATGDLLAHGVTTAIDAAVGKLTPLITKGITSALGFLGKREEDNAGDLLLQALGTSAGTALGTATGELAGQLLTQGVNKAIEKGIPALTSGISSALSHLHLGKREEDSAGDLLLQALGTSAGTALGTATGELAGQLLTQGVTSAIEKGIPALTSGISSALSHLHLGRRNLVQEVEKLVLNAVEQKLAEKIGL